MSTAAAHRYLCERCGGRFSSPGDCPRCDEEPLLDVTDPDVLALLEYVQQARGDRRYGGILLFNSVVLGAPLALGLFLALMASGWLATDYGVVKVLGAFVLGTLVPVLVVTRLVYAVLKPRTLVPME